ncbi:MAG: alkaline phosphatase family protein [Burkholderiales bacterium]
MRARALIYEFAPDRYEMEPMSVGLPTSTPAFQMAAMYGVRPDIPGFHYYDRERRGDIHFPRAGHAAYVETKQAAGRRGILDGGSAYGCCFTGGAANNFFSFASLTRPSGRGVLSALSPFVVVTWVLLKNVTLTVNELVGGVARLTTHPRQRRGWRWLMMKIGMSVWIRGFFTMAVSRDLYAGVPRIYVNYLDYDVFAHAFGPRSRKALQSLRGIDRAIHQLWRVSRRVPEHDYDIYILSDHEQAKCTPYKDLARGQPFERWIFDEFLQPHRAPTPEGLRVHLQAGIRARRRGTVALFQKFMNYLEEDFLRRTDPEAHEQDGVRVISAGPNAFLYVVDAATALDAESMEKHFPGLLQRLSLSFGVGFVLARSADGPVCYWRGKHCTLGKSDAGPFSERPDASLVIEAIEGLMRMPSAGDVVIYGTDARDGTVSFIREYGAHAGPSADEMQTFILARRNIALPHALTNPVQLYDHFIHY